MAAFSCLSYCLAYAFVVVFSKIHRFCSIIISVVCGSRAEVVLRPIFVTWLCRACVGTRGLISLNFSRPGPVSTMFCGSRAEVILRLFTAVLPKRLYETHTPCIHYHLRDNTHRLLLWPYTSPCPLSTSWHLFRMVCFSLFPPHSSP